jgi:hypothetical protein
MRKFSNLIKSADDLDDDFMTQSLRPRERRKMTAG